MGPQRGTDGRLVFVLPMGDRPMPGIAAADIGACAAGVFRQGASMIGHTIGIAGEHLTGAEMASALSRVLHEPVTHVAMPPKDYAKLGFPGADDLANMFQFNHDFAEALRCGAADGRVTRAPPRADDLRRVAAERGFADQGAGEARDLDLRQHPQKLRRACAGGGVA